jgi:hypothetical protein
VTTNGAIVQISASVDSTQISRGISARTAAGRRGSTMTAPVTTGAVPITEGQSNPNVKPGRVVILGMDDGPKEITIDGKK